jgi:hypothetical protein
MRQVKMFWLSGQLHRGISVDNFFALLLENNYKKPTGSK